MAPQKDRRDGRTEFGSLLLNLQRLVRTRGRGQGEKFGGEKNGTMNSLGQDGRTVKRSSKHGGIRLEPFAAGKNRNEKSASGNLLVPSANRRKKRDTLREKQFGLKMERTETVLMQGTYLLYLSRQHRRSFLYEGKKRTSRNERTLLPCCTRLLR